MMLTKKEILLEARQLLSDPSRWTKGAPARNAQLETVGSTSEAAFCFCAIGAIRRTLWVNPGRDTEERRELEDVASQALRESIGRPDISRWNDDPARTHEEVLAAFDRAIATCP